jgi:hypothetical protein
VPAHDPALVLEQHQPRDLLVGEQTALGQRMQLAAADVPLAVAAADLAPVEDRDLEPAPRQISGVDQRQAAAGQHHVEVGLRAAIWPTVADLRARPIEERALE